MLTQSQKASLLAKVEAYSDAKDRLWSGTSAKEEGRFQAEYEVAKKALHRYIDEEL